MRKGYLAGAVIPLVVALGLWLSLGAGAAAQPRKPSGASAGAVGAVSVQHATLAASHASLPQVAADADNVRSGDQTGPDTAASESAGESESGSASEAGTGVETDTVDCQRQGQYEGINAAGSGPGCDGTGT